MSSIMVETLKRTISSIEQASVVSHEEKNFSLGSDDIDQLFAGNGIPQGSLLEVLPQSYKQRSAAIGATLAVSARLLSEKPGPVIWCQLRDPERLHLHAPGLMAFGIDPANIIKLTLKSERDLLWAIEEALDCSYVSCVVGVLWSEKMYDFKASRRLLLRAKENGVCCMMLRSHRANATTAATLRWSVKSLESNMMVKRPPYLPRLGQTQWQLDILKSRLANSRSLEVGWNREAVSFHMASRLGDRKNVSPRPVRESHKLYG